MRATEKSPFGYWDPKAHSLTVDLVKGQRLTISDSPAYGSAPTLTQKQAAAIAVSVTVAAEPTVRATWPLAEDALPTGER